MPGTSAGPERTTWMVDSDEHFRFVALSGDANPIHADEGAAQATPFGRILLHGMHLVLRAAEEIASANGAGLVGVDATFRQPFGIGERIEVETTSDAADDDGDGTCESRAVLRNDDETAASIDLRWDRPWASGERVRELSPTRLKSHDPNDLVGASGSIAVEADSSMLPSTFPNLIASTGSLAIADLLSVSRLIGMEMPGEHSLSVSYRLARRTDGAPTATLSYVVDRFDDRFNLATMSIDGAWFTGSVRALRQPSPP